jgi:hypothetical protein
LSAIPHGSTISSAKVYLDAWFNDAVGKLCKLKRNISDFDEATATWNTKPVTTDVGEVSFIHPAGLGWVAIDVTSFIQDMVNGLYPNYGFTLKLDVEEGPFAEVIYWDSENANPALRPYLLLEYSSSLRGENRLDRVRVERRTIRRL